jgi:hypothetical protein
VNPKLVAEFPERLLLIVLHLGKVYSSDLRLSLCV